MVSSKEGWEILGYVLKRGLKRDSRLPGVFGADSVAVSRNGRIHVWGHWGLIAMTLPARRIQDSYIAVSAVCTPNQQYFLPSRPPSLRKMKL